MDNKIYKNKHPSDFTSGSIIRQLKSDDIKTYLYVVCNYDGIEANIYAVGISINAAGSTWLTKNSSDWELIRGSLKK